MRLVWNGRNYRPVGNFIKVQEDDINELMKPLSEKTKLGSAILTGYVINAPNQDDTTPSVTSTPTMTPTNTITPTPSFTPTNTVTPTQTQTNTPSQTQTQTNTPTPSITPEIDCVWSLTDELWENNSNDWNVCQPVISPTPTITQTQTQTQTNTPTPSSSSTPLPSGTTEANAYLSAVVDAGGTGITSTVSAATRTLFTSLVSNGLWDKMVAFYPMLGGNSSGCKFNGKNPVDTNAGYRLVFNGGWTYNASGATSNGTNAYANTFLTASTITPLNSQHLSLYMANNSVPSGVSRSFGGANGGGGLFSIGIQTTSYYYWGASDNGQSSFSTAISQGNLLTTANSTASSLLYRNGTQIFTAVNDNGKSIPYSVYIGAYNNAGTAAQYYANQYRFSTIGYGLSSAQVSTLSTIINTFQTSLTRNVY